MAAMRLPAVAPLTTCCSSLAPVAAGVRCGEAGQHAHCDSADRGDGSNDLAAGKEHQAKNGDDIQRARRGTNPRLRRHDGLHGSAMRVPGSGLTSSAWMSRSGHRFPSVRRAWAGGVSAGAGRRGCQLALALAALGVGDVPGNHDSGYDQGHQLGGDLGGAGRAGLDDEDRCDSLSEEGQAPDDRGHLEGVAETGIAPAVGEVTSLRGVRSRELPGETEDQRSPQPQRVQADDAKALDRAPCGQYRRLRRRRGNRPPARYRDRDRPRLAAAGRHDRQLAARHPASIRTALSPHAPGARRRVLQAQAG